MKYWETIVDNLSKAGWSWGCVSAVDSRGRAIFVADAYRGEIGSVKAALGRNLGFEVVDLWQNSYHRKHFRGESFAVKAGIHRGQVSELRWPHEHCACVT